MRRSFLIALLASLFTVNGTASDVVPSRFLYDFIVPADGSFTEAVHAANARPDKRRRFRIFIMAGRHLSEGDGTPLRVKDGG